MDFTRHYFPALIIALTSFVFAGCSISPNLNSSLESDELYLSSGEVFITDAEYLAHAYDESEYDDSSYGSNSGSNSQWGVGSFNRFGGLGLGSYFSPYGAGNMYGGYNSYSNYGSYGNYGNYNPYSYGNGSLCYGGYGSYNPYGYGYGYGGYNPYNNGGGYYSNYYGGGDTYTNTTILVGSRTPLTTNTTINSNYTGGRLHQNKIESVNTTTTTQSTNSTRVESRDNNSSRLPTSTSRNNSTRNNNNSGVSNGSRSNNNSGVSNSSRSNNNSGSTRSSTNSSGGRSGGRP